MTNSSDVAVPGQATFSTATEGLRECNPPEVFDLADRTHTQAAGSVRITFELECGTDGRPRRRLRYGPIRRRRDRR